MNQKGISFVELMICISLTSLLMTLIMQHYLMSKRQYLQVQTLVEEAFELQLVTDSIRDSLRKAGFTPCIDIGSLQTVDRRTGKTQLSALSIRTGKYYGIPYIARPPV